MLLVLAGSAPLYLLDIATSNSDEVVDLPLSAIAVVIPVATAVIVTSRNGESVRDLLASGVEPPSDRRVLWSAVAVGAMPALVFAAHVLFVARDPDPDAARLTPQSAVALAALFLAGSYGEEIGWTSLATRRLLARHSVLATGSLVALLWTVWHAIPFIQTNHSWGWIGWQLAFTVAFRVLITGAYAASGRSTSVAIGIHASYNMAWSLLPRIWSAYQPAALAPLTAVAALVFVWAASRARAHHRGADHRDAGDR